MDMSQILKIEKYNTGIPKIEPSPSKMKRNGTLNMTKMTIPFITNFCSCLFFMFLNYKKQCCQIATLLFPN